MLTLSEKRWTAPIAICLFLSFLMAGAAPSGRRGGAPGEGSAADGRKDEHAGHAKEQAPADTSADPAAERSIAVNWFEGGGGLYVPSFYDTFKDIDLSTLDTVQRERFLHWVNTEYCGCGQQGCHLDTVANCYTNDSRCPRAPARIREILENVKKGAAVPWSHRTSPNRTAPPN